MPRSNDEVASLLHELAVLTELDEGSPQAFRVRAYNNAERSVRGLSRDVAEMAAAELADVKGIGKSIAAKIREFADTGTIAKLEELRERHPAGQRDLLRIPGMGPKSVALLREVLGVVDVDGLVAALDAGKVEELPGMGKKAAENLRQAIERLDLTSHERRLPIADALPLAESVVASLSQVGAAGQVQYAGSLRRFRETIGDVDLLVASDEPATIMDAFVALPAVRETLARGETKTSVLTSEGLQLDLRVVEPAHFGAALVYFTGSKAHNIRLRERALKRGWTLNEYALAEIDGGRVVASRTEEDVYAALDLAYVPPEVREDSGEIEAAERGELPDLVRREDLRGDLHDHTDRSGDGRDTLEEMVEGARARGLAYLAVTDHAENLRINGVSREEMLRQREELRALGERYDDIRLLHGAELNIDPEGGLDYDEEFLAGFDWCVASVHSHFRLPAEQQTKRVVAAIRHPAVNVIGHLTGRRIGKRPGIDLDVEAVLDAARETGTAIEVNANLDRLDAASEVIREAALRGVTLTISSDAHTVAEFDNLEHGVRNARRGWAPRELVANTWEVARFLAWARAKRES